MVYNNGGLSENQQLSETSFFFSGDIIGFVGRRKGKKMKQKGNGSILGEIILVILILVICMVSCEDSGKDSKWGTLPSAEITVYKA